MRKFERNIIISLGIIFSMFIVKKDVFATEGYSNKFPIAVGMKGKITTDQVNIRTGPDLFSRVVGQESDSDIMITGKYKEWYRIRYDDQDLWVSQEYVSLANADYVPEVSLLGEQIVEYGKRFIGTPYRWGGTDLNRGIDCSAFTQKIYSEFDIDINRTSYMQPLNGKAVPKDELRSGDLVFFDTNGTNKGRISHVGVYIGDGEFIHSSSSKGITLSSLNNTYYKKNYVKSVRVEGLDI